MGIKVTKKPVAGVAAKKHTATDSAPTGKIVKVGKPVMKPLPGPISQEDDEALNTVMAGASNYDDQEVDSDEPDDSEAVQPAEAKPAKKSKPTKVKSKDSIGTVSTTYHDGSVTDEKEVVKTGEPTDEPVANVGFSCGLTRNLGNYESIKFQVSINIPCPLTAEDIDSTYEEARAWVDAKISELNDETSANLGN